MNIILRAVKWLLKTAVTIALIILMLVVLVSIFVAGMSFDSSSEKPVAQGSYIVLGFPAGLTESPSHSFDIMSFRFSDLGRKPLIFPDVLRGIAQAENDSRINGIMIDLDNWNISAQQTGEIIGALNGFKASGKKVISYGSVLNRGAYYAASGSDEIIIDPSNSVSIFISGSGVTAPYFKDAADKIGVKVNVIHVGEFKGAGENFSRSGMSDELRESITRIIDERTDVFAGAVSENRKFEKQSFLDRLESGEFVFITPAQALELGIVDKLLPYEDMLEQNDLNLSKLLNIRDYPVSETSLPDSKIAVILAEGAITDPNPYPGYKDNAGITPDNINSILTEIRKDSGIKAVVLRVNSPGGSPLASEKILRNLNRLKEDIPVIVSFGSVAASGGYYISCGATKIFAEQNSITGSIGVVSMIPNFKGLYDILGINSERISRGRYSDIFDLTKETTAEDLSIISQAMVSIYDEFISRVSEGRNIPLDDMDRVARGQIWTGREAVENGLADELGGLTDAIRYAALIADIENYETVYYPKNLTLSERILSMDHKAETAASFLSKKNIMKNEIDMLENALKFGKEPVLLMPLIFD